MAYRRKERYIRYTPDMGEEMRRTRCLIDRLRVIDRDRGFRVWYQPILCLEAGRYCSMEALVRLREADGSLVSPAEFIPLAEQTGMISAVTWFVLEDVCGFLAEHPELCEVSVSVNLLMAQLLEKDFQTRLNGIVDSYGVDRIQGYAFARPMPRERLLEFCREKPAL